MKTSTLLFSITCIYFLVACSDPIKKSNKIFEGQTDTALGKDFSNFTSSMEFLYYSNPTNYWYPEEYTFKDIVNDKFKRGYEGLEKLYFKLDLIKTDDSEIQDSILSLQNEIRIAQKEIKKKQSSIEGANSLFGLLAFGGISGLVDMGAANSSSEEREKAAAMPNNVKIVYDKLTDLMFSKYRVLASKMNNLETRAFEATSPTHEEKTIIRNNLKSLIRYKIKQDYSAQDTICRDQMVKLLFDYYDKHYTLDSTSTLK